MYNIDLQRMHQKKTVCLSKEYYMDGTRSYERKTYLSGAHVIVDSITPIYHHKSLHLSALAP